MPLPSTYSFTRYLASKKSVDDRALNGHVWQTLSENLPPVTSQHPLQVLEIGAGIGTMLERLLDRGMFSYAVYTALDAEAENIACAGERLPGWAVEHGYAVENTPEGFRFTKPGQVIVLKLLTGDLFDFISSQAGRHWDLLIAHAFLDLLDIPSALPQIFRLAHPHSLFYFSINFDGLTLLEPLIDPVLDETIQCLYHKTMDERLADGHPSGDSQAGRHLFQNLRRAGASILDAGASDWVVFPGLQGYPHDEAYFLHFIIHTIQQALDTHTELVPGQLSAWAARRHAQIETGELVYIAHQLDFVGRAGSAAGQGT